MTKQLFFLSLSLLFPIFGFSQCAMIPASLQERITASDLIVEGRVVEQKSYLENGLIYTNNKIEIYKILKGLLIKDYISIRTEGGLVGDKAEITSNLLWLETGEYGVFMCKKVSMTAELFETFASAQGFIRFDQSFSFAADIFQSYANIEKDIYLAIGQQTKQQITIIKDNSKPSNNKLAQAPVILDLLPKTIYGGMKNVLTITGRGFGASKGNSFVEFPNVDNGGIPPGVKPVNAQYRYWSDTEIQVEVPYKSGSGRVKVGVVGSSVATSSNVITVPYSQINVDSLNPSRARHVDVSGDGGYLWTMNKGFKDSLLARTAFEKQFSKWRCATDASWNINTATTSLSSAQIDGINIITYDNLPTNVLGVCRSYYKGCTDGSWYVSELDISFNKNVGNWHYDEHTPIINQMDFSSVVLHELGHGMQLAHTVDTADLMYYALKKNQIKTNIDSHALAGVKSILAYGETGSDCGPAPMAIVGTENCSNPYHVAEYVTYIQSTPNPCTAETKVQFSLEKSGHISIDLYDYKGNFIANIAQKVLGLGLHEESITFDNIYPTGMYFIRILRDDKVVTTGKIIKQ